VPSSRTGFKVFRRAGSVGLGLEGRRDGLAGKGGTSGQSPMRGQGRWRPSFAWRRRVPGAAWVRASCV